MASKGSHVPQVRLIEQAHKLFMETKDHVFESKSSEEHAKLLRYLGYDITLNLSCEDTIASFLTFK